MEAAYRTILETVLPDGLHPGVVDTPGRAARAMQEMTSGYAADIPAIFRTFDAEGYDELILERDIPFASLCEHHLLPFTGVAHIGYIPVGRIIGLSKLARLVEAFARRLQVQERLTSQLAEAIETHLQPLGTIVVLEAAHSCMSLRGVRKPGVIATTSAIRGVFATKPEARAEVLSLIRGGHR